MHAQAVAYVDGWNFQFTTIVPAYTPSTAGANAALDRGFRVLLSRVSELRV